MINLKGVLRWRKRLWVKLTLLWDFIEVWRKMKDYHVILKTQLNIWILEDFNHPNKGKEIRKLISYYLICYSFSLPLYFLFDFCHSLLLPTPKYKLKIFKLPMKKDEDVLTKLLRSRPLSFPSSRGFSFWPITYILNLTIWPLKPWLSLYHISVADKRWHKTHIGDHYTECLTKFQLSG